jgi:hypothetical protein
VVVAVAVPAYVEIRAGKWEKLAYLRSMILLGLEAIVILAIVALMTA